MPAPIWRELFGQGDAIAQLELAVKHRDEGVHHAWLMTGPPGSGRSNMAVAFAAALLCADGGDLARDLLIAAHPLLFGRVVADAGVPRVNFKAATDEVELLFLLQHVQHHLRFR